MKKDDHELLLDIVEAAEDVALDVAEGLDRFADDRRLQRSMKYLVQCIGENAAGLSNNIIATYPEVPWRRIIGMRHRLVHDYTAVDLNLVWNAAAREVPILAEQVAKIVQDLESGAGGDS